MQRRRFLAAGSAGAAGLMLGGGSARGQTTADDAPAPAVSWRLASTLPASLDIHAETVERFARRVGTMTGGRFVITRVAEGDTRAGTDPIDAVLGGAVDICHTLAADHIAHGAGFAAASSLPFGLDPRMQTAWMEAGEGAALLDAMFRARGLVALPLGAGGPPLGAWFRREVMEIADLRGLPIGIRGLAGRVLASTGALVERVAPAELATALQEGRIAAAAWGGPHDDLALGIAQDGMICYLPGWWQPAPVFHAFANAARFDALPPAYQAALRAAAAEATAFALARQQAANPVALRRLIERGNRVEPLPGHVIEALFKAAETELDAIAGRDGEFKALLESQRRYRGETYWWFQYAEGAFNGFMSYLSERRRA